MEIKVEIGQFNEINKGPLAAWFSVLIHPYGLQLMDCSYFVNGDKSWINFPQKLIKKAGEKDQYWPQVKFIDRAYDIALKDAIIKELKLLHKGKDESRTNQGDTDFLSGVSSAVW